jgi:phospholipase A1
MRLALLVALVSFGADAFCESEPDDVKAQLRESRLFSEFKDNYFITGWPWSGGQPGGFVRFQVSVKANLVPTRSPCTVFFTFTQKTLWDLWNFHGSSPFVDSNYNPGLFLAWRRTDAPYRNDEERGMTPTLALLGFEHESNGRDGPFSRSWNRFTALARFAYFMPGGWSFAVQPTLWAPLVESRDSDGGGNPDLTRYFGYGQLLLDAGRTLVVEDGSRKIVARDWSVTTLLRAGTDFAHGLVEVSARKRIPWPRLSPLALFAQCSFGYGEVLLTYNQRHSVCRVGLSVEDRSTYELVTGFQ